jgi:hypothetical protein
MTWMGDVGTINYAITYVIQEAVNIDSPTFPPCRRVKLL